jgi:hypothetical protein
VWAHWLLLILYAGVGVTNVARGVLGFVVGPAVAAEAPALPIVSAIYVAWGLVFLGVGVVYLVKATSFDSRPVLGAAVLYQVTLWVIKLVGERASYARSLWPRDLLLMVVFVGAVLLLTRAAAAQTPGRKRR